LSRRDSNQVAWHEVPGKRVPKRFRPVGNGMIGGWRNLERVFTERVAWAKLTQIEIAASNPSYRTLRDGSQFGVDPGTSCQATINAVPPGQRSTAYQTFEFDSPNASSEPRSDFRTNFGIPNRTPGR
jgi:hypothetical protein